MPKTKRGVDDFIAPRFFVGSVLLESKQTLPLAKVNQRCCINTVA
jgi:hypothetical protein